MIKARHSGIIGFLFNIYLAVMYRLNFSRIDLIGEVTDKGLPVLMLGNHISWWDGFWMLRLNENRFRRRFFIMMLEEQLKKNMFLRRLGAFSINPGKRDIRESIQYASEILKDPGNLLVLFPQGSIHSIYDTEFVFERGVDFILSRAGRPVQIVMVVHMVDYFSEKKPFLRQYICSPPGYNINLQQSYNEFYKQCLAIQLRTKIQ